MKRKTLFLSLTSLTLVIASLIFLGLTYGWFNQMYTLPPGQIKVGDLRYTMSGDFIADDIITPGQELINSAITMDNASPIDSQMRIQITYTKVVMVGETPTPSQVQYSADVSDHLSVEMNASFVYSSGYFYYGGTTSVIASDSGLMSLVTSVMYDGSVAGIDYSGQPVSITITIQVKQADNVTWNDLATYDFSTGYPA